MDETILKFEFNPEVAKWKKGQFNIIDLQMIGSGEDLEIEYEDIKLYLDDVLYTGGIDTFTQNNVSVDWLFENVLNSYLRNNTAEYDNFDEGWEEFRKISDMKEDDGKFITKLPVYDYGVKLYELQLVTSSNGNTYFYYTYNDECMILDQNGDVVTNIDSFYFDSFVEDLVAIFKKDEEITCLYKSEDTINWIVGEGGEQKIIEEYGY